MANIVDKVADAQKFLNVLSWKKLMQLAVFIFIIGLAYSTYENREIIYGYASQKRIDPVSPSIRSISKKSAEEVDTLVKKSELIVAIQIILVDFQRNTRHIVYSSIDDASLQEIYAKYTNTELGEVPLFTSDVVNNKHLVELINGEFACQPFADSMTGKVAPQAGKYINTICSNGIPASYGRFTGIVAVYLKSAPTTEEVFQLRSVTRSMATTIFERDLNR